MEDKRKTWNDEDVEKLIMWWPHWGTEKLSEILNISQNRIKSKVDKIQLKILPKEQRLCVLCQENFQLERKYGLYCKVCFNKKRKLVRQSYKKPRELWMKELLRTLKHRSIEDCNLTLEYLINLWNSQNGKCLYSMMDMREPVFYGKGRAYNAASLDRIDSKRGYIVGNVVWCCWGCNTAKQDFSIEEFIENCGKIYKNKDYIMQFAYGNRSSNFFISNNSINMSP